MKTSVGIGNVLYQTLYSLDTFFKSRIYFLIFRIVSTVKMMKQDHIDQRKSKSLVFFGYLLGVFTAFVVFSILSFWIAYRIGFSDVIKNFNHTVFPWVKEKRVDLPEDILQELTALSAGIANAGNPTNLPPHNTLLVAPDEELTYRIRPNVKIAASHLETNQAFNFDPPVLFYRYDDHLSGKLKAYIKTKSRHYFSYTTDSDGFRKTTPEIKSDSKILIIGDSVPFGVGVNDEHTAASFLQDMLNIRYRVINASVGGYNAQQAFKMAEKLAKKYKFEGLVYIASQNDFMEVEDWNAEANDVLNKLKSISNQFANNIIIVLHTYMEYNLRDIFLDKGWSDEWIEKTHQLRQAFPKMCKKQEFAYFDWTDIVESYMEAEKSLFSRFALYVDHGHLSPLGNRLIADKLYNTIAVSW
jgi:lysophospholipase L1-like esterase